MGFFDYGRDDIKNWIKSDLTIKTEDYTNEKNVEKVIFEQLKILVKPQNVHTQYSVGGFLPLKIDIDLYDGSVGIELKLAKELGQAINAERLLGQIIYYSKRKYKENLIVLIVGGKDEYTASIKELETFIKSINICVIYKNV